MGYESVSLSLMWSFYKDRKLVPIDVFHWTVSHIQCKTQEHFYIDLETPSFGCHLISTIAFNYF